MKRESRNSRDQAAKTLRSLRACQIYLLRSPEVVGEKLRVAIEGEQSKIKQLLAKFDKRKVPIPYCQARRANQVDDATYIELVHI